ncbi:MAG TPA: hypothetical protein VEY51_15735 [Chondromyces sp.]|nr:hypothetical protein [Chondromyces sp.]
MKKYLILFLAFSYVGANLVHLDVLNQLVSAIVLVYILSTLPNLQGMVAKLMIVLSVLTVFFLIGQRNIWSIIHEGTHVNLAIVTIFALTPVLSIPFRTGGYMETLKSVLHKKRNQVSFFYISTAFLTQILGVVINVGSISINNYLSRASNVTSPRLRANAMNRGFAGAIAWSPYFAAMALVISHLHIEWSSLVIYAIGFAILSFLVGFLIDWRVMREETLRLKHQTEEEELHEQPGNKKTAKKLTELIFLLLITTGLVLAVENFSSFNMVMAIALVSILFPVIWCLVKGNWEGYKQEVKQHLSTTIPNLQQEISLFLMAGLFSASFVHSPWSHQLVSLFSQLFGQSAILMTITLSLIIVAAAISGLHPIVVVTILVTSIDPEQINFSPQYFALTLLGSWSISNVLSPVTAANNLIARNLNQKLIDVSIKWNWKYGLIMLIILPLYLYTIGI